MYVSDNIWHLEEGILIKGSTFLSTPWHSTLQPDLVVWKWLDGIGNRHQFKFSLGKTMGPVAARGWDGGKIFDSLGMLRKIRLPQGIGSSQQPAGLINKPAKTSKQDHCNPILMVSRQATRWP